MSQSCTVQSTCPYCGVGCGIDVDIEVSADADGSNQRLKASKLIGSPSHPANYGRLCVKGTHLLETTSPEGRLLQPAINGKATSWDEATSAVAKKLVQTIEQFGPDAVAFYVSGQLLTEDYYVANKLMKGFIGSPNIDTNSRLCMSSAVAGYKRAFGADVVPCSYEDLEQTDLLVLIGSNAAWTHPVLFQRMELAKKRNPAMKIVVIDPRKTASASLADLNLPIRSGTDTVLFNGLLNYLAQNDGLDKDFIEDNTDFADSAFAAATDYSVIEVSKKCDVDAHDLLTFYKWFSNSSSAVSFYSMGINQSVSGVDNANAIINCHLASGKLGKPGCGPFSITGQPNAMGGREVGGLANMLAAHMDIENVQHNSLVGRFWKAPNMVKKNGLKAVDMFEKLNNGDIKFIWIMATNPVVSMPNRQKIEQALLKCDTVVVSDTVSKNDTLEFANIVLPATGWSEKDGTVTNSERRISRQRALFPPTANAKHDWQIICEVATKLGFGADFAFDEVSQIFAEHAKLTAFENEGTRALDLSGLANITQQQYDVLQPIQWPINVHNPEGSARMFSDHRFFTENGRAKFMTIVPMSAEQITTKQFPFILNTGRMRDQWHTMTRTGNAARLHQHTAQAELSIHPEDARELKLVTGDLVSVHAKHTARPVILPLKVSSEQRKGDLFAPIHWSKTWTSHVGLSSLFTDANDAISGQPELKHAAVTLLKTHVLARGVIFSKQTLPSLMLDDICDYWIKIKLVNGYEYRVALLGETETQASSRTQENSQVTNVNPADWFSTIALNLIQDSKVQTLVSANKVVAIETKGDRLSLFVALNGVENNTGAITKGDINDIDSSWLDMLLHKKVLTDKDVSHLLRNRADEEFTQGKQICSCFSVRENSIKNAIKKGYNSVALLGENLKCGTNCGSCKSELSTLITQYNDSVNKSNESIKELSSSNHITSHQSIVEDDAKDINTSRNKDMSKAKDHIDVIQIEASK